MQEAMSIIQSLGESVLANSQQRHRHGTWKTNVPLEPLTLIWQEMLDICTVSKDALELALNNNPDVKQAIDPVEPVLPRQGIIFKHLQGVMV